MQIHIISIGKLTADYIDLAKPYSKIIKWTLKFTEISHKKKLPIDQIKQYEARLIKEYLIKKSFIITLEIEGKNFNSQEFSNFLKIHHENETDIIFIIGGAFGLDQSISILSNLKLSLSSLTLPHQLAKIILIEQIYRAQMILQNHPYHK